MSDAATLIVQAVRAAMPAGVKVYDAIITDAPPPPRYVVLYIPEPLREITGVAAVSDGRSCSFQATSVASNPIPAYAAGECRILAGQVSGALVDLVIVPDGMTRAQIVQDGAQPPRPDEATPDRKVYATAQFSFRSVAI